MMLLLQKGGVEAGKPNSALHDTVQQLGDLAAREKKITKYAHNLRNGRPSEKWPHRNSTMVLLRKHFSYDTHPTK